MTIYTIKWTETQKHEVDIEASNQTEALERFWMAYHSSVEPNWEDSVVGVDGPTDIEVVWLHGHINSPKQKQETT